MMIELADAQLLGGDAQTEAEFFRRLGPRITPYSPRRFDMRSRKFLVTADRIITHPDYRKG